MPRPAGHSLPFTCRQRLPPLPPKARATFVGVRVFPQMVNMPVGTVGWLKMVRKPGGGHRGRGRWRRRSNILAEVASCPAWRFGWASFDRRKNEGVGSRLDLQMG
jgi:hypothetical protein